MRAPAPGSKAPAPADATARQRTRSVGPGRVLAACYALFVLAAGARSAVQLTDLPDPARLAHWLSAAAALVYAVELVLVLLVDRRGGSGRTRGRLRTAARWVAAVELGGVIAVGAFSVAVPRAFPEASVWSHFGSGYGFVPLVLPVLALWWLRVGARGPADAAPTEPGERI